MAPSAERSLISLKKRIKGLTSNYFWLRYSTLAAYRTLAAATSTLTGLAKLGAAHAEHSVEEAVGYITASFDSYVAAAGSDRFYGRMAEIGPGDSCGIGLMFLARGCEQADLVDRFFSRRDDRQQQAINRAIVQRHPQLASVLRDEDFSETSFCHLTRYYGASAAAETFFESNKGYDFIVSNAVLEHLYDPLRAVSAMVSALNPGGMMFHQVDCSDHEQFSTFFHELKFLELPPALYAPMRWGGGPNRVRLSSYANVLRQQPVNFTIYVTSLAGIAERLPLCTPMQSVPEPVRAASRQYIASIRNHLSQPFRHLCDEDLMTTSFMISAKRNAG